MSKRMEVREARKRVKTANAVENPLDGVQINLPDQNYSISSQKMSKRPLSIQNWVFETIKANVSHFYDDSCPWSDADKRTEILHPEMWNVLINFECSPVGFANFRFDMDDKSDVLYLYEVHVVQSSQRKGIGRILMSAVEQICVRNQLSKVVLTSHKGNVSSQKFFRNKLEYVDDVTSPIGEPVSYEILSKSVSLMS